TRFSRDWSSDVCSSDLKNNNSDLTKTLALSLMYNSPSKVAKKLFIHPNTVHYRINRAKQLLNVDEQDPSSDIALRLAAYAWLFRSEERRVGKEWTIQWQ